MKKVFIILPVLIILTIAYFTKPDNKTIVIDTVTKIWGDHTPTIKTPQFYNQFMDVNSKLVHIEDWIFFKRVRYKTQDLDKTIAIGAFSHIFFLVE